MSKNKNEHYYLSILGVGLAAALSLLGSTDSFASSYSLSLTSSGSQNIDVPGSGEMTAISSDSINVSTTCRYGYNFTINTSVSDNNLYLNGNSANNTSDTYFTPTNGTAALKNNPNAWGYYYNDSAPTTAPTSSNIFSPVPALGNTATIKSPLVSQSNTDINDSFNIYYGVASSSSIPVGNYKMIPDTNNSNNNGTIVYTATIADACTQYTVQFSPTSEFEGNTLSGTGTMNDQSIYEGVATALTSNGFTAPSGYYFAGWNTAQDGSGTQYTNGQQVTDLTTAGSSITLYAMWTDCPANRICYNANVSNPSDAEGEMGNQTISSSDTEAVLYAPNFSRTNYGFEAWNTNPNGTGTNYGPNQTIEFNAGAYSTGGLKLYAKWVASAGNMQGWTCPNDTNMPIGTVTALKDTRDNNVYAIAKLADGKCWMIENLRLENTGAHNTDGTLSQGYNSSFIGLANPESANFISNGVANSLYSTDGTTTATISGSYQSFRFPRYNNNNTNSRQSSSGYSTDGNTYSMGNYYTWHAAIADTTYYSSGNHNTTSICPAGWHIPTGAATTGEFALLDIALGGTGSSSTSSTDPAGVVMSSRYRSYPNNFLYSGYFDGSSADNRGSVGYYWSSTARSIGESYFLYLYSSNVSSGTSSSNKLNGFAIRCTLGP